MRFNKEIPLSLFFCIHFCTKKLIFQIKENTKNPEVNFESIIDEVEDRFTVLTNQLVANKPRDDVTTSADGFAALTNQLLANKPPDDVTISTEAVTSTPAAQVTSPPPVQVTKSVSLPLLPFKTTLRTTTTTTTTTTAPGPFSFFFLTLFDVCVH